MSEDQPPSSSDPGGVSWLDRLRLLFGGAPRDRRQLESVLEQACRGGLFDRDAHRMLEGVLEVSDTQVRDVMIPRPHMVTLERDASPQTLLARIIESGHSRFPVIGDNRDEVVGILLAKDLLRFFVEQSDEAFDIRECLRPAVFIPESKRLNNLLKEFRASHNHMAIVVDEYGGVSGLATIEDVIEQIVGEIDDEHDIEEDVSIQQESPTSYTVRALTRIEEFNEYFGSAFPDDDYDTVGGLIMHELGRLPRRGEAIEIGGLSFKILRGDRRRIESVQVSPTEVDETTAQSKTA